MLRSTCSDILSALVLPGNYDHKDLGHRRLR